MDVNFLRIHLTGMHVVMRRSLHWRCLVRLYTSNAEASTKKSVALALLEARHRLKEAGQSASDAKVLVAHALQPALSRSNDVFLHSDRQVSAPAAGALATVRFNIVTVG